MPNRTVFRRDPFAAFDRFVGLFTAQELTSVTMSHEILSLFAPSMFMPDGSARWTESDAPIWLEQDPRWLMLCAELCQDETHGAQARTVLRYAAPGRVLSALEAARARRTSFLKPVMRAAGEMDMALERSRGLGR